eukprot:scaffold1866_cov66-Cylindrotheca_fusiformis.AAC.4
MRIFLLEEQQQTEETHPRGTCPLPIINMTTGFQPIPFQNHHSLPRLPRVRQYEAQECGPHDVVTPGYTAEQNRSRRCSHGKNNIKTSPSRNLNLYRTSSAIMTFE